MTANGLSGAAPDLALTTAPAPRLPIVDAARGAALAAMIAYHLFWDLGFFGFIPRAWIWDPRFIGSGHVIAGSFLALVGVGLALAARGGFNARAYLRRLVMIAGAALLVTIATWFAFPQSYIFFGILHCIALASVLALPFLRAPWPLTLLGGVVVFAAPWLIGGPALEPIQWWSGLGVIEPRSNDWRPLFPWAGLTLLGLGGAQALLAHGVPARLRDWRADGRIGRLMVLGGRRSLLIYLLHQPLLYGLVFLAAQIASPTDVQGNEALFTQTCVAQCAGAGAGREWCQKTCGCIVNESKSAGLWSKLSVGELADEERTRYRAITQQCLRRPGRNGP